MPAIPKKNSTGALAETYREYRSGLKTAFKTLDEFSKFGLSRRGFKVALVFGTFACLLEILQLGIVFRLIDAIVQHRPGILLNGPAGYWMKALMPQSMQGSDWVWAYLLALAALAKGLEIFSNYRANQFLLKSKTELTAKLCSTVLKRSLEVGHSFFHQKTRNDRMTLDDLPAVVGDRCERYSLLLDGTYHVILGMINLVLFITVCGFISPVLVLVLALISPLTRWISNHTTSIGRRLRHFKRQEKLNTEERYESLVRAFPLIKAFNQESYEFIRHEQVLAKNIESKNEISRLEVMQKPLGETRKLLSTAIVLCLAPLIPYLNSIDQLPSTFIGIMLLRQIETQFDRVDLGALMLTGFKNLEVMLKTFLGPEILNHYIIEGSNLASFREQIEIKNLDFCYGSGKPALNDLNLKITPGSVTAIVGATGSGKSTISKVLLRLYNVPRGTYLVDGIDACDLQTDTLRDLFSIVPQVPVWMERPLQENLRYGSRREISDEELRRVCAELGILEKIESLPEQFNTQMNQDGSPFSQGQQQCLAIARALLKDSPIMILDEPTSGLDALSEARVLGHLEKLKKDKTVIVVAHRLSTILGAHQILVLDEGRIIEQGKPADLIRQRGPFFQLWQSQGKFWRHSSSQEFGQLPNIQNLDG